MRIQIPAVARNAVRAFVKRDPRWPAWAAHHRIVSRQALNQELVDFCIAHRKLHQLAALICMWERSRLPQPLPKPQPAPAPRSLRPNEEPISAGEMAGYLAAQF